MLYLYVYPIIPAIIIGLLSARYYRKQGYTSIVQPGLMTIMAWAGFHLLFKYFIQ